MAKRLHFAPAQELGRTAAERPLAGYLVAHSAIMEALSPRSEEGGRSRNSEDDSQFSSLWRKEKLCIVCETKLSSLTGDPSKRHGCKFCGHAVCTQCSPLKMPHPSSAKPSRMCVNCYKAQLETKVKEELEVSKPQREAEWIRASRRLEDETWKRRELEETVEGLKKVSEENEQLRAQLTEETLKRTEAEEKLSAAEKELLEKRLERTYQEKNFETALMGVQQSVDKYRKTLALKVAENMGLRKQVEQYKAIIEEVKGNSDGKKAHSDISAGMGLALSAAKQLHSLQVAELNGTIEDLKGKLQQKVTENEQISTKMRENDEKHSETISKCLQESQTTLRKLTEYEQSNELLQKEVTNLRDQLHRLTANGDLSSDAIFTELKIASDRQISVIAANLEAATREKSQLQATIDQQTAEIQRITALYEEQTSLLSLAEDDILSENREKLEFESKLEKYERYIEKLEQFDEMSSQLSETTSKLLTTSEMLSRQRLETEQFKHMLKTTQETLEKCEELIRAGQEQIDAERKLAVRRETEIEELRRLLQTNGIDAKIAMLTLEDDSGLSQALREKEAKVGKLGMELHENLEKLRFSHDRKLHSATSSQRHLSFKPAVSTEPCACSLF